MAVPVEEPQQPLVAGEQADLVLQEVRVLQEIVHAADTAAAAVVVDQVQLVMQPEQAVLRAVAAVAVGLVRQVELVVRVLQEQLST